MAVASNTVMYNSKNAPSYVSSSAYYGYVPPNLNGHQLGCLVEGSVQSSIVDGATHNLCSYGSAMETDDDGYENCEGTSCLNNPCVIPEGLRHYNRSGCRKNDQNYLHRHNHLSSRNNLLQRRNRKRNGVEDLTLFGPSTQIKRFREEAVVTAAFTMVQKI